MIIKNFKTLKRNLNIINVGIKNNLINSDKEEEDLGNRTHHHTFTGNKNFKSLLYLIRANSFLGGKVYFRVNGELIPAKH